MQNLIGSRKVKNFQRNFSQRECVLAVASIAPLSARTMILPMLLQSNERSKVEFRHNNERALSYFTKDDKKKILLAYLESKSNTLLINII